MTVQRVRAKLIRAKIASDEIEATWFVEITMVLETKDETKVCTSVTLAVSIDASSVKLVNLMRAIAHL